MKSLAHQLGERVHGSHPSRGAWIEILAISVEGEALGSVAPLAGCVD